jgi:hypothetical protein
MIEQTMQGRSPDPVRQFSVFTANRMGRLHDLTHLFAAHDVHVLAMTVLDTTDSAIIRLVVDDPERARALLREEDFPFTESDLLVVEIEDTTQLDRLTAALVEAELNVHYLYPFILHAEGKAIIAINMEDKEVGEEALKRRRFRVLRQGDISR